MTLGDACDALFHTPNQRHERHKRHRKDDMKQIKIQEDLFYDLVIYHILEHRDSDEKIKKGLMDKMDAIFRHQYYSDYKINSDETAREEARQKYLDSAEISKDFRW